MVWHVNNLVWCKVWFDMVWKEVRFGVVRGMMFCLVWCSGVVVHCGMW